MAKSPIVLPLSTTFLQRFSQHFSTDGGRNPIGLRTESDRTADGIQSDCGRNPIGRRTRTDRTANGIRSDGGRNPIGRRTRTVAHLGGALVSARLCRLPEQEVHQPSKKCANRARAAPSASPISSNILPQNTQNSQNLLLRILPQISRKYTDC